MKKANGPSTLFGGPFNADFRGHQIFSYYWASLDFAVNGYEPRKIGWISVGWYGGYLPWRIEKGIGLFQSTCADILKAYGMPTVETVPVQGQKNMIYDAIGIAFQVYDGGKTGEIRIFPTDTAKSIWKF